MALSDLGEVIAHEAAFSMQAFDNPDFPLSELGELGLGLSTQLRALAVIQLLVNGDSDGFHHNLIRSGRFRLAFLERLRAQGIVDDHHGVAGRFEPVLDLIAASQFADAARIGSLGPQHWTQGHEYEDDYCYAVMLHRLAGDASGTGTLDLDDLAARVRGLNDDVLDPRSATCVALARRDSSAFHDAFEALLKQRTATIQNDKARSETLTAEITALRQVYIEGLAMLSLAKARGVSTLAEYMYCPSLARVPMHTPFTE